MLLQKNEVPQPELQINGKEKDSLCWEASAEFNTLVTCWERFEDPLKELNRWCMHYYGKKHVPINYALTLWKKKAYRDGIWPFVRGEFLACNKRLEEYEPSKEIIKDIRRRLITIHR